jgi:hypothetical protein
LAEHSSSSKHKNRKRRRSGSTLPSPLSGPATMNTTLTTVRYGAEHVETRRSKRHNGGRRGCFWTRAVYKECLKCLAVSRGFSRRYQEIASLGFGATSKGGPDKRRESHIRLRLALAAQSVRPAYQAREPNIRKTQQPQTSEVQNIYNKPNFDKTTALRKRSQTMLPRKMPMQQA